MQGSYLFKDTSCRKQKTEFSKGLALFLTKTPDTHYSTEGGGVIEGDILLHFLSKFSLPLSRGFHPHFCY